jgi:hypothetical protein
MLAATIEGSVIDLLREAGLVGGRVWAEDAPEGATRPYITLLGPLSTVARLRGDGGETMGSERLIQVNLWQDRRLPGGAGSGVDPSLVGRLVLALDGGVLDLDPAVGKVYQCHVQDLQRVAEPDGTNLTHHALTLSIKHDRGAI